VVAYVCDRVAVMYLGKIVELGTTRQVYFTPKHPYSEALLSSVPQPDPDAPRRPILLSGERPDPANPPSGCRFHTRCRYATERCAAEAPALRTLGDSHQVACHYADELKLRGAFDFGPSATPGLESMSGWRSCQWENDVGGGPAIFGNNEQIG
jgi:oligopeptide/dipeptide ABC transporter ATP-binding protein